MGRRSVPAKVRLTLLGGSSSPCFRGTGAKFEDLVIQGLAVTGLNMAELTSAGTPTPRRILLGPFRIRDTQLPP